MNAAEAREMTEAALVPESELVRPYVHFIEQKVRLAASLGLHHIDHPFPGSADLADLGYPDASVQKSVQKAFEANGFTWNEYPDPDPGSPGSGPYTSVSWR